MRSPLAFVLLISLLTACQQSPERPQTRYKVENPIDWANPQHGQKTWYQRYESECDKLHRKFAYTGDTLVVEIVAVGDTLYLLETLSEQSVSRLEQGEYQPAIHRVDVHQDYLLLPERWASSLFFFFGNDTLPLRATQTPTVFQEGCTLTLEEDPFVGNETGQLDQFVVGPISVEEKLAMSCLPGGFFSLEMRAYLLFDAHELFLSHTVIDQEEVRGWVRMD